VIASTAKPFFTQALDALKGGDRRGAALLLERELREGNTAARNLTSVFQLAVNIGEIEIAIDALRRASVPNSIDSLLPYWSALAMYGRSAEALAQIERQSSAIRNHPSVLHFRGTMANYFGRLEEAKKMFRQALSVAPDAMQTWFALSMVKTFKLGDPDLAAMESLESRAVGGGFGQRASLCYGIGKAYEDLGDVDEGGDVVCPGLLRAAGLRAAEVHFGLLKPEILAAGGDIGWSILAKYGIESAIVRFPHHGGQRVG